MISIVGRILNLFGAILIHISVIGLALVVLYDLYSQIKFYVDCKYWFEALGLTLVSMAGFGLFLIVYSWFLF